MGVSFCTKVSVAVGGTGVAVAVAVGGGGVLVGTAVTLAVCCGTAPHAANTAHTTVPINKRLNCRMSLCVLVLIDRNGSLAPYRPAL